MLVRRAQANDSTALQQLYDEHLAMARLSDRRIRRLKAIEWSARAYGEVWVGEESGRIAGYVSMWARDDTEWGRVVFIDHMALDAHMAFPGLARELINAVRGEARVQGCSWLVAEVPRFNPIEQAFWMALGAERMNRRAAPGCELMRLSL